MFVHEKLGCKFTFSFLGGDDFQHRGRLEDLMRDCNFLFDKKTDRSKKKTLNPKLKCVQNQGMICKIKPKLTKFLAQ
jgi:hypothetical protein